MRNYQLALAQEFVSHADAFIQQSARVLPQVKYESLQIARETYALLNTPSPHQISLRT